MTNKKVTSVWGLNENSEIVTAVGSGTDNVTSYLVGDNIPVDDNGRLALANVPKYAKDAAGNVTGLVRRDGAITPIAAGVSMPLLTTICIGNSIAAQCRVSDFTGAAGSRWATNSEMHWANTFAKDAPLTFTYANYQSPAQTTQTVDNYGVFGASGKTLTDINTDVFGAGNINLGGTNFLSRLATAGVTPKLVFMHALLENSITQGHSVSTMKGDLLTLIDKLQTTWPGVKILIGTPHPSFGYTNQNGGNGTGNYIANYIAIRDFVLSLDDSVNIFVTRQDAYENQSLPGMPLGTTAAPIYTDAGPHPNFKGAVLNARRLAATINRIANSFYSTLAQVSANKFLLGSAAASGINVTGTVPTGLSITGTTLANYTAVAETPGALLSITPLAAVANQEFQYVSIATSTQTNGANTLFSSVMQFELVSGAENMRMIIPFLRLIGATGNPFLAYLNPTSAEPDPDFLNGDVLTFRSPPLVANTTVYAGTLTSVTPYWNVKMKATTGKLTYRVKKMMYEVAVA
jgi:hypothetical protein